jgi:hypothetical protein
VEVHLDYFGRVAKRDIELFTKRGTIIGDIIIETIRFSDGRDYIKLNSDRNRMYLNEMEFFIDNIIQNTSSNNVIYCKDVLDLALGRM